MKKSVFWIIAVGIILFSGCKTFEPAADTPLPLTIPETFSIETGKNEPIENWWFCFGSDELNTLIKDALDNNFDLKTLKAKVAQSKARVEKENASFFPDLGFSFGGQKTRTKVKTTRNSNSNHIDSHSWDSSLSGSYTADVWGEAKASKQARVKSLQAVEQDLKASTLELTAQIAIIWIDIITTRNKKNILNTFQI